MENGDVKEHTVNSGGTAKPVYVAAGVIKPISDTVGANTPNSTAANGTAKPVYLNAGTITALTASAGSATNPVYMDAGTIKKTTYGLGATVYGGTANKLAYYSGSNEIDDYASTVGSNVRPVYMNAGVPTQVNASASGNFKNFVPMVGNDGAMEFGKYIDFHESTSTNDYDLRLHSDKVTLFGESNKYALYVGANNSKYNGIVVTRPVLDSYRFVVSDYQNGPPVAKTVYDLNNYSYSVTARS